MATAAALDNKTILETILEDYASIPYATGDLEHQLVFDEKRNRYLLLTLGWQGKKHVHYALVHVELRGDKFWIHYDGTEDGIAYDLEQAGIPKEKIVLAWYPEKVRQHTGYAVK
jgi:XisI protein